MSRGSKCALRFIMYMAISYIVFSFAELDLTPYSQKALRFNIIVMIGLSIVHTAEKTK